MKEIKAVNLVDNVRDNMVPHKTRYGAYYWLEPNATEEQKKFYYDCVGILPPEEGMEPIKINNKWYWNGDNSQVEEK